MGVSTVRAVNSTSFTHIVCKTHTHTLMLQTLTRFEYGLYMCVGMLNGICVCVCVCAYHYAHTLAVHCMHTGIAPVLYYAQVCKTRAVYLCV
jgi:hypothetical protein